MFMRFMRETGGATAVEYGLLAGLIGGAIIVSLGATGTSLQGVFELIAAKIEGPASP
ncbi:Flp family type IVb pilin [Rhizobium sp. SG2393]|uniref:Flp family type IVb pilin n=1 Tax=Rhizobium sp. SG2393 TaxID=3276279 RepID=UPI00366B237D